MKRSLRLVAGFLIVAPFMVSVKVLSIFVGHDRANKIVGPALQRTAKRALKYWVPRINNPEEFDHFSSRMKKNFWLWKPFYDIEITKDERDVFQLHISNCPFCEILNKFGFSDLSLFTCQGDWDIARDNSDKWLFERTHQIGSGDSFCDHTYKRIK